MKSPRSTLVQVAFGALCSFGCTDWFGLDTPPRKDKLAPETDASSSAGPDARASSAESAHADAGASNSALTFLTDVESESSDASSALSSSTAAVLDSGTDGATSHQGTYDETTFATSSNTQLDASSSGGDETQTNSDNSRTTVSDDDAGADSSCGDEATCGTCSGCLIAGTCIAEGTQKPSEPCWICKVDERSDAWVANIGENCGDAPTECSQQDTCNAEGQCAPNHREAAEVCGDESGAYVCDGQGECADACSAEQRYCDGECTNVRISKLHCGECNDVCPLNGECSDAECDLPDERSTLDFEADLGGYALNGPDGACVGQWVNVLGDFDGDGKDEFSVAGFEGGYVLKGSARRTSLELDAMLPNDGWFIHDSVDQQPLDGWVRSGGDINGDGRRDLTVLSGGNGTPSSARVLFTPSTGLSNIDLSTSSFDGFDIIPSLDVYFDVQDAGDFNADGKADLIGVLPYEVVVFYGTADTDTLVVDELTQEQAVRISLPAELGGGGAGAGDVNDDGKADVIVSQYDASLVSVIYGRTGSVYSPIDISEPGDGGFKITGSTGLGMWVGPAGDFNGDGFDDVATGNGTQSWVIFGRESEDLVDVSNLGNAGVYIEGNATEAAAGDVNGDGFSDLMLGDNSYGPDGEGAVYVIFGSSDTTPLALDSLGARGQRIESFRSGDMLGLWVSSGDIDGDGFADLLLAKSCVGNELRGPFVVFGVQ